MSASKTALVLDTNVYLHFNEFSQIKWGDLVDGAEVIILLPPIVLRELDAQKDSNSRRKIRERARKRLKQIEKLLDSAQGQPKIELVFLPEPQIDYSKHGLVESVPDDQLLASCLDYIARENLECILVTDDTTPRLKARALGIKAIEPPSQERLVEDDTVEKELRKLQRENIALKSRLPKLALSFASSECNRISLEVTKVIAPISDDQIESEVRKLEKQYPERSSPGKGPLASQWAQINDYLNGVSPKEYQRYNEERLKFFEAHRKYLKQDHDYRILERLTFSLELSLTNNGTAPAEDIDIWLHVPDGITVWEAEQEPLRPEPPSPPLPPQPASYEFLSGMRGIQGLSIPNFDPNFEYRAPNISAPDIRRTNSFEITLNAGFLKQHTSEDIQPIWLTFEEEPHSFEIEYSLNSVSLPKPVTGLLHIIVES